MILSSSSSTTTKSAIFNKERSRNQDLLPIDKYKRNLLYLLEKNDILIVVGETGSGKSTRIPQILLKSGSYNNEIIQSGQNSSQVTPSYRQICITEPRRVAAVQLAQRVCKDLGCDVGKTVGYTIRFQDVSCSQTTKVKFVTEGIIIREMMMDPSLMKYSVIIVDEIHERNLQSDILLGLLACLMKKRNDLKLILCSATMNIDQFRNFYSFSDLDPSCGKRKVDVMMIHGKTYPIRIYHLIQPTPDYLEATIQTIIDVHEASRLGSGKLLAFLTGQDEVEFVCEKLREYSQVSASRLELRELLALPLYGSMRSEDISRVFDDYGRNIRVCIIATNVAETSLTIDDIAFVVDCGFTKLKQFDPVTEIDHLVRANISKSSANQRAGRAGRTREGIVYRLYTESDYEKLEEFSVPEILRTSMVESVMLLMSLGVKNPHLFPLPTPMSRENFTAALELLNSLGAVNESGELTSEGEIMAQLNVEPRLAKCLIVSTKFNCSREICKIVAMLQINEIYSKPRGGSNPSLWTNERLSKVCVSEGDMISYLNIMNGYLASDRSNNWADRRNLNHHALKNASEIASKLESQLKKCHLPLLSTNKVESILKSLVGGLFPNAAYLHPDGAYRTIRGEQIIQVHPTSVFFQTIERPKYVVFNEILHTTKVYMRHMIGVEHHWLLEAAPQFYTFATELQMSRTRNQQESC